LGSVYQLQIALSNLQFIASIKLLLISVPRCHLHGVLEQSHMSPKLLSRYYTGVLVSR